MNNMNLIRWLRISGAGKTALLGEKMIDRFKINMIVERIKMSSFEFETIEVEENLFGALAHYGYDGFEITEEEYQLLVKELLPMAEQYEFREAERLAYQREDLAGAMLVA